ncbi:MAG: DUF559 domain-containing protein [Candidatus Binataceae bacterium]
MNLKIRTGNIARGQVIAGFIVDFYCHSVALAIELDGAYHDATVRLRCQA